MAGLCPRCGVHERTLETLGVFRCAACGRVNADGEQIPDGATEAARFAARVGDGSFAAPPPVAPRVTGSRAPFPTIAIVLIAIQALLTLVGLAVSGPGAIPRTTFRVAALAGIVIGDRDSYRAACGAWLAAIVGDAYLMTSLWRTLEGAGRTTLVILLALDAAFLAVLLSREMRRRYE